MRREIISGALALGLLTGCAGPAGTPESIESPTQPTVSQEVPEQPPITPDGLPMAVKLAARSIVSIEVADIVDVQTRPDGSVARIARSELRYGTGVHIGDGNVLTANHNYSGDPEAEYGCFGQQLIGQTPDGDSYFYSEADASASNPARLGDIALVHSLNIDRNSFPAISIADPSGITSEQAVYLITYQSPDTNEVSPEIVRSPAANDEAMRDPAIFSGVAKRSPDGSLTVVTGTGITEEYGSGNPQRLTGGGSGGALVDASGKLLGILTAYNDAIKPNPSQIVKLTDTQFTGLQAKQQYWLQTAVSAYDTAATSLRDGLEPCAPDANDSVTAQ